jgi:hypothetical protein
MNIWISEPKIDWAVADAPKLASIEEARLD